MIDAFQLLALLLCVAAAATPAQATLDPSRDVLRIALQGCVLAKKTTGRSFPCLSVDLGDTDRPGTAVLRAPGQPTHTVVMPTAAVVGLEAPQLQQAAGNTYWKAALAARSYVLSALRGRLREEQVGLAVNSVGGRSQDQLHIHLDCIRPTVRTALQRYSSRIRESWTAFPAPLVGGRFLVRRIDAAAVDSFNPFAALRQLPGKASDLRSTSFAVIAGEQNAPNQGFYVLAYRSPEAHAEMLLDHSCSVVSKTVSQ